MKPGNIFFTADGPPWKLTSHARKAREVFEFLRRRYAAFAAPPGVVIDHLPAATA